MPLPGKILVWGFGIIASIVLITFLSRVDFESNFIYSYTSVSGSVFDPSTSEKAKCLIEKGWKMTDIGYDSCGNFYIEFEKLRGLKL
jgi:hypothetical protein